MRSEFLSFIQPAVGLCEIRCIRGGHVQQAYYEDRAAAEEYAYRASDRGWDVYYGVLPRIREGGKATDVSALAWVLWADIDAKAHMGDKQYALAAIVRYPITPSVIVDSGHGYHAYWKLDAPYLWDEVRPVLVGLAHQLRGDHVYDQPRILRIPGTMNHKGAAPVMVRTIRFDTTRVLRLGDFYQAHLMGHRILEPPATRQPVVEQDVGDQGDLPPWLLTIIDEGAPQGQRSEASFRVMVHLIYRGWSDERIRDLFRVTAIGEKYREQRDGERWLARSLRRARG